MFRGSSGVDKPDPVRSARPCASGSQAARTHSADHQLGSKVVTHALAMEFPCRLAGDYRDRFQIRSRDVDADVRPVEFTLHSTGKNLSTFRVRKFDQMRADERRTWMESGKYRPLACSHVPTWTRETWSACTTVFDRTFGWHCMMI